MDWMSYCDKNNQMISCDNDMHLAQQALLVSSETCMSTYLSDNEDYKEHRPIKFENFSKYLPNMNLQKVTPGWRV